MPESPDDTASFEERVPTIYFDYKSGKTAYRFQINSAADFEKYKVFFREQFHRVTNAEFSSDDAQGSEK